MSPDAEPEVITFAYKALAKKYHPDRDPANEELMARINQAYEILKDPAKRANYDRQREQPKPLQDLPSGQPEKPPAPIPKPGWRPALGLALLPVVLLAYLLGCRLVGQHYLEQGREFREAGLTSEALTALGTALRYNPHLAEAFLERAQCFLSDENPQAAVVDLTNALAISPDQTGEIFYFRGIAYAALNEFDKARADWQASSDPRAATKLQESTTPGT